MNPEEELPPDVAPRAYYHQPVWKRIVVIGAGPAVNLVIAFLLLFGLAFGAAEADPQVADITQELRSGRGPAARGPDRRRGRRAQRATRRCLRARSRATSAPASRRPGCRAATPAVLEVERDGRVVTMRVHPRYDPDAGRTVVGFTFGAQTAEPERPGGGATSRST